MISNDTYILAPHSANNFAVLQQALAQYPEILQEKRVKDVYRRNEADIVAEDGGLLVPYESAQYIYLCATVPADSPELAPFLAQIEGYTLYTIDTQPFDKYWL